MGTDDDHDGLLILHANDVALLGRRLPLRSPTVTIGRGVDNTIVLDGDGISRHHARLERCDDGWWWIDLESTNGSYVNGERVTTLGLRCGDRITIGDTILRLLAAGDTGHIIETEYTATPHDGLTGLYNRRHLLGAIDLALAPEARAEPLALVLFDLERFKRVNDTFGHLAGDEVLRAVAARLRRHTLPGDVLARHSGDKFAILRAGADLVDARASAAAIGDEVAAEPFVVDGQAITVRLSVGVVVADERTGGADDLVRAALVALDHDKRARRSAP